jgi:hypothetical protein
MVIRVDVECTEGHRQNDVMVAFDTQKGYPEPGLCSFVVNEDGEEGPCGAEREQVYDNREQTEGYFVMRGVNW